MDLRTCSVCGSEFQPKSSNHRTCPSRECQKAKERERWVRWRVRHPDGAREASRRYRERNGNTPWPAKRKLGLEVHRLKSETPCADCGNTYPPECMDFDHIKGEKRYSVGTMVAHGHSRNSVMAEIAKCELVCANCHRIRTRKRKLGTRSISEDPKTE